MPFIPSGQPLDFRRVAIEADRIVLISISVDFTDEIFRHFTPEITRFMMPAAPSSIEDTRDFITAALAGLERGDDLHLVICRRDGGEFLGICGLHERGQPAEPELGIWLKKAAHGNGYGLEAMTALRDWVETHIEFERLIYPVDRRNIPSRRIAEELNGSIIEQRKVTSMSGKELDEVVYAIARGARR